MYTLFPGPMVYTLFPCFPRKRVYTIAFFTERREAPRWWCILFFRLFVPRGTAEWLARVDCVR